MANSINLENILNTGVKFYASKSKADALALATLSENAEPGALCFVSDNTGNYIILDGKIFGDGTSGGGGTGEVISVNGKKGVVILQLSDFTVVYKDGEPLKTLSDYFNADGTFITNSIEVKDNNNDTYVKIDSNGVKIGNDYVVTSGTLTQAIEDSQTFLQGEDADTLQAAKDYADSLLVSLYRIKGSVQNRNDLNNVQNPQQGDVYNVTSENTNYVYTGDAWAPLGGGSVDLSNYYKISEIDALLAQLSIDNQSYVDGKINSVNTTLDTHSTAIQNLNNTFNSHTTSIKNNATNITNIATQLTWQ